MKVSLGRRIVCFFTLFALICGVVSVPFRQYEKYGDQYINVWNKCLNVRAEEEDSIETVFLGDSLAWAGMNPVLYTEVSGKSAYNLATSGQWLRDGYAVLNNTLETQKPKLVVLEANEMFAKHYGVANGIAKVFPVFHYHDALKLSRKSELDGQRGFNAFDGARPYTGGDYLNRGRSFQITRSNAEWLAKLVTLCQEHDMKLAVVSLPCAHNWNQSKHDATAQWAEANNVPFLDLNMHLGDMDFDWQTDTRDGGEHLNSSGAGKATAYMTRWLSEVGL